MILYFSGSGNSLAIARKLAEKLNEQVILLREAVSLDLSQEKRIGLELNHRPTLKELQYHHPDVQLKDMMRE